MVRTIFVLLFSVVAIQIADGQPGFKNCRWEWTNYYKCLKEVNEEFRNTKDSTDLLWLQIETDMQTCFRNAGCRDPFVDGGYRAARRACFNRERNRFIRDMNAYLRRQIPQSDLPAAAFEIGEYNRYINYMNSRANDPNSCPPGTNKGLLFQCIRQSITQRTQKIRETQPQCQEKQFKCDQKITDECYENWQRYFKPLLSRGVNDMRSSGRLQNYKYEYSTCVRQRTPYVFVQNPQIDPNLQWFDYSNQHYVWYREICGRRNTFG